MKVHNILYECHPLIARSDSLKSLRDAFNYCCAWELIAVLMQEFIFEEGIFARIFEINSLRN